MKIANTYLLPIFYYLGRFYLKSAYVDKATDEGLTKWLITANNTNLPRLRAPTHQAGLSCPLVDHRSANVATLLDQKPSLPAPTSDTVGVYSLHMSDHWARAADKYIEIVGRKPENVSPRAVHLRTMVHSNAEPAKRLVDTIGRRLKRHDDDRDPVELVKRILENSLRLPDSLSTLLRNHFFDLTHSLLYTSKRTRGYRDERSCPLCGSVDDSVAHLLSACPPAEMAVDMMRRSTHRAVRRQGDQLFRATMEEHLLQVAVTDPKRAITLLSFSFAIWRIRWKYTGAGNTPNQATAAQQILQRFSVTSQRAKGYHRRDRSLDKLKFEALMKSLPPAVHIYTDGSSYGNPGPAGSGFVVRNPKGKHVYFSSNHIGHTTNDRAELDGIKEALSFMCRPPIPIPAGPVFLFVDNRWAINTALGRTPAQHSEADKTNTHILDTWSRRSGRQRTS